MSISNDTKLEISLAIVFCLTLCYFLYKLLTRNNLVWVVAIIAILQVGMGARLAEKHASAKYVLHLRIVAGLCWLVPFMFLLLFYYCSILSGGS